MKSFSLFVEQATSLSALTAQRQQEQKQREIDRREKQKRERAQRQALTNQQRAKQQKINQDLEAASQAKEIQQREEEYAKTKRENEELKRKLNQQ